MRILLIDNYFPPEIGAASHLYYYLGKELVRRGHEVTVLTGIPRYNVKFEVYKEYLEKLGKRGVLVEIIDGMKVIRVRLPYVDRKRIFRRGIEHFEIAYKMYIYAKDRLEKVDVSLVYSPPLTLYWTADKIRRMFGSPFILNVQDLFPQAAIDLGILKNKFLITMFKWIEKRAYNSADLITVHSENNKFYVDQITDDPSKTLVFENWVDDEEIKPGSKENDFSIKYGLTDKFVVSFAGTLGYSQDLNVILKAAEILKDTKDIVFLIVGDGVRRKEVEENVKERDLENVLVLPPFPRKDYPKILHSSDISLATLQPDVRTPVVPSKILSIMSAGIPVVASMNLEGDAPKLIEKAGCGFVVPAGDHVKLAEKIRILYENEELRKMMGRNGRRYIEENLSAKKAAERYEKIFFELIRR